MQKLPCQIAAFRGGINPEFAGAHYPEAHERLEGMEEATVMMVGLELERIQQVYDFGTQPGGDDRFTPLVDELRHQYR